MKQKKTLLFGVLIAMTVLCTFEAGVLFPATTVDNLRCEYLDTPLGIETPKPRFSWNIVSTKRDVYQTTCRLIVSDNVKDIQSKRGNCWDSGIQASGATFQIEYNGENLRSAQTYYWRVCTQVGGKEIWSIPARFHTGLFRQEEWKAAWIGAGEKITDESPLLRNTFVINKKVKNAFIYASAAGAYELYLNGRKVGDEVLNPSITDYRKTVLYSVYDISGMLLKGENAFGVMLGNSAYNVHAVKGRHKSSNGEPMGDPRFIMQMKVVYEDGSEDLFFSGEGKWKYSFGAIVFNHFCGGEDYDARKEQEGWAAPGFDDSQWKDATTVSAPGGLFRWQAIPIRVTETIIPVAKTKPARGVYLFDLGQNIAGWWRISVRGKAGQTIRVRGSETLNKDFFPKNLEEGDVLGLQHDYHANVWTDYTLRGNEKKEEVYEPRFFYTGFRYIEVTVSDKEELPYLEVEGRVVRSDLARNGEWISSNPLLNKIYDASIWAIKSNMVGYPTDCPHREKGAYTGDGQVVAEASMRDFQIAPFYCKWLNDMRDAQQPNGRIPNTAPTIIGGTGGGIGWGSAYVLIPWWMYQHYSDVRIMEEHYPTMKRYIEYLRDLARTDKRPEEPYIINDFGGYWDSLGEWCAPGQSDCTNHPVVSTFYYYYDTKLMAQIAEALGHKEDAFAYTALCDTIKDEFNKKFFSPETMLYGMDSAVYQPYQLLALIGDLVKDEYRAGVINTVVADLKNRGNHLNTGIIGTKYLWPVLSANGFHELAYSVATQTTYPSFGYWIENNATTLLENWEGNISHNHQMFASIIEYFYDYLAGIRKAENGYKSLLLAPVMPDNLQKASGTLQTMPGKVVSEWEKLPGGKYKYHACIPANVSATLLLPISGFKFPRLTESGKIAWENDVFTNNIPGVKEIAMQDGQFLRLTLGSGDYRFILSSNNHAGNK